MMRNVMSGMQRALWNWNKQWFQHASNSSGKQQGQKTPSKPNPLKRGLNRGISLSGHCTGKLAVTSMLLENVVRGPPHHGMFWSAPMWNGIPRLKRACAGVEMARRPCWYSEHCPNVGRVRILRKCLVRAMSPESWPSFSVAQHATVPKERSAHTWLSPMLIRQAVAAWQPASRGQTAAGGTHEHDEAVMHLLQLITLNNTACLMWRQGKLNEAMLCF